MDKLFRLPTLYTPTQIKQWAVQGLFQGKGWIPIRTIKYPTFRQFPHRLKLTWYVFIGKYDVLNWDNEHEGGRMR